jgi:CRISPR-associated protein Cmr1
MSKVEIKVQFETITPLWTGDAWMENNEIRPSSLIGSLRFWFEVYYKVCKNEDLKIDDKGVPKENLEYEKFKKKFYEELDKGFNSIEEVEDKILKDLGISISSRVLGCTGWKSRIKIKDIRFEEKILEIGEINTNYPVNSRFWIKKTLFNDTHNIKVHHNVNFTLLVNKYWFCNYLKEFFDFYSDKLIIVGGKKSFGLGFVKIKYISSLNCSSLQTQTDCSNFLSYYCYHEINCIPKIRENLILGFNFRYFLRKNESDTTKQRKIFGEHGKASSVYISNFDSSRDKKLKLIIIKNPFDNNSNFKESINEIAEKFKNDLKQICNRGNR